MVVAPVIIEKKKPKHYFNNLEVEGWVADYYSRFSDEERMSDPLARILYDKIFKEISKVINGIIFTHKYTIWEPYEDLFGEAAEACIKALPKFDPMFITSNGKNAILFNYMSITAKQCLKFYTIRNQKHRNHSQIEDYAFLSKSEDHISTQIALDSFNKQIDTIFNEKKNKRFIRLAGHMKTYLERMGGEYNKRDFFRYVKSLGWSPNLIRKFLKILKENQQTFW